MLAWDVIHDLKAQISDGRECGPIRAKSQQLTVMLAAWAPFHAGAEVAAERLAGGLQDRGHQVTVLLGTEGVTAERMRAAGLDVRHIKLAFTDKLRWWKFMWAQQQLLNLLRELRPDIVHANDLPTSQMIGRAAARCSIARVCHHRWIFHGHAADWLNKFGAEHHIFISQSIRSEMFESSRTLAAAHASIVHDGMSIPPMPLDEEQISARHELELPLDRRIVLFAGQIIERKGVRELLLAWSQLPAPTRNLAQLVIVGEDLEQRGSYRAEMESLASELNVTADFQGFRKDIPNWIKAADICVVPSHREPFGLSVLEAMAHGRAVIGSDVGGIPEMIEDRITGLVVPPRNPQQLAVAIETLVLNADLCQQLGKAARERAESRFSLSKHVREVEQVYHLVLKESGSTVA